MVTFCTDPHQLDSFAGDKIQALLDDSKLVNSHFDPLLPWRQLVAGNDLQEFQKLNPIAKILVNLLNEEGLSSFPQM